MQAQKYIQDLCPDYYSDRCPCIVTQINYCPVCSFLGSSHDCNDCNWAGKCIQLEAKFKDFGRPPMTLTEGKIQHIKSFELPGVGILFFGYANRPMMNSISVLSTINLISHQQPHYCSIPGVVLDFYRDKQLVVLGLNTLSVRENYFIQQNKEMSVQISKLPAVLGLNKLNRNEETLIVSSRFGDLLAEPIAKQFNNVVIQPSRNLPPLLKQRLSQWAHQDVSTDVSQIVSLGNYTQHKKLLRNLNTKQPLQMSLLNNNLFH